MNEAHIQHTVGFVEDEDFHVRQPAVPLVHQVEQSAGRSHEDVQAFFQRQDLFALRHAAEDGRMSQMGMSAIGLETLADLNRQFACGGEDQRTDRLDGLVVSILLTAVAGLRSRVLEKSLQRRQSEGGGFARARLGAAEHVLAFQ